MKQCENPHVIRGGAVNHGYNEKKCYKNTHLEVQKVVHHIYFLGMFEIEVTGIRRNAHRLRPIGTRS